MRHAAPNRPSKLRTAIAAAAVALAAATCAPQSAGAQEICYDYATGEQIDCPPEACVSSGSDWRPWGLWPTPWTPQNPSFNLPPACINQPYSQWIRIDVGETWELQGLSLPVNAYSLPTSDGIRNLPVGVTYTCQPPNCYFPQRTTYCVHLQGTPTAANSVGDTLDMVIKGSVHTVALPIPVDVPGDLRPGAHYYIPVQAAGTCPTTTTSTSSTTSTSTTSTSTTSSTVLGATTTNPAASSTTTTNPAGSSTTLADPAGTSTTSAASTTTSTTLPGGCSGTPYAAIACQLDALAQTIVAAPDLGRLAPSFAADVVSARARARGSATSCGAKKTGPARKQLRRVAATLAKIVRKLKSRAARNVSETTRNAITKPAADLGANVKGLAARLACPDDAT